MKTTNFSQVTRKQGFTLVELLTVIAIVVILAGMSVAAMGWANSKAMKEKTTTQLRLLENGVQQYQADAGSYPTARGQKHPQGAKFGGADSLCIYAMCFGDVGEDGTVQAGRGGHRLNFKPHENGTVYISELDPRIDGNPWFNTTPNPEGLLDPYGRYWYYRSGQRNGMNPDFDLWSVGAKYQDADSEDDITNW